jgi:hypothetical protein
MINIIYDTPEYTRRREILRSMEVTWRDMSSSCAIPNWGEAICDKEYCLGDLTCAQIAHSLLKIHFPGLDLRWRREEMALLDHRPPKIFRFPITGQIGYLDIKSAYKQLYQYLYLHSDFPYKRQRFPLFDLAQTFNNKTDDKYKIVRNAVVGITRSTRNKYVCRDKVWYVVKRNKFLSPTLWAQLMGILNQIASDMIDLGAVWINTDGYAFTSVEAYDKAINYFDERGIIIGDKGIGHGYINGLTSVHIQGVKNTDNEKGSTEVFHLETSDIDHLTYWMNNRKELQK